ncbi:MAG TPA: hypothetical protein VLM89_16775 [Phycisphaerae bacterium]|nr:hypothetical protein [Phycisphaerae bacterium]
MRSPWHMLAAETIERRLEFSSLPHGWMSVASLGLLSALLLTAALLYRREQRAGLTRGRRVLLTMLRGTTIAVLAAVWLEPVLATYVHRTIDAETLILVDGSTSMTLRDRYEAGDTRLIPKSIADPGRLTRAELVCAALEADDSALLKRIASKNPVRLYQFAGDLRPIGFIPRGGSWPIAAPASQPDDAAPGISSVLQSIARADGAATDLGQAMRTAVEQAGDTPIAAIVVLSDGRFNRGESAEVVARFAQARRIPVHAVGVGDPADPRNAALLSVESPANVFVKDPFQITARIKAQGLAGQPLSVELLEGDGQSAEPSSRRTFTPAAADQVASVVFQHQLDRAGQTRLRVRIALLDGEILTTDNQRDITVRALDNRMRVLLVAGGPSWEYRYVSRLLTRDATMDLSCWLQSADETAVRDGKTIIDHFPTADELTAYDCIILLDPQPRDFSPQWCAAAESMVSSSGAGLLYVAGRTFAPQFVRSGAARALLDVLPVALDAGEADLILNELGYFQTTAWPVSVPPEATANPVLALADSTSENLQAWSRLPGWYWHYPASRAKPVATVLLRHSNPRMRGPDGGHVLLATQFVGSGRTGFLASDSTWRWRRAGESVFNRFWVKLLRHLVEGKLSAGQQRGLIQTEREEYAVGDAVIVEARLLDDRGQPLVSDTITAAIQHENDPVATLSLKRQPQRPGWYRGRWVSQGTGRYAIRIELPGGPTPAILTHEIRVAEPDLEFRRTSLDRQTLALLAEESAGGQYFNLGEADKLPELIPGRQVSLVLTGEPFSLWDRWWTLALLVALLGTEWFLRKRACLL